VTDVSGVYRLHVCTVPIEQTRVRICALPFERLNEVEVSPIIEWIRPSGKNQVLHFLAFVVASILKICSIPCQNYLRLIGWKTLRLYMLHGSCHVHSQTSVILKEQIAQKFKEDN
jgi:hypothetical protein